MSIRPMVYKQIATIHGIVSKLFSEIKRYMPSLIERADVSKAEWR
jgi:hypothetical protein